MKAIIPVAGVGTNLRPLTYTQPKPLIPVAGKPIISFIIDQLQSIGVQDFVFVIGYLGEKIKHYITETYPDIQSTFVHQEKRLGTGHAIWTAREALKDSEELLIFFGDTIVELDMEAMKQATVSCLATHPVDDPREFGVVELDDDGNIIKLVEKPRIPKSNLGMVGFYKIKEVNALLEGLQYNIENDIKTDDEYQLTDGLMRMLERGIPFVTLPVENWFDCGQYDVLLKTNAIFLDKEGYASDDLPAFDNSIIIHPVSIGKYCQITNSIIGPHVSIGDAAQIDGAILKESIIGNYVSLQEVVLKNSVIGNDTSISGAAQKLNIGDNTAIDFSQ